MSGAVAEEGEERSGQGAASRPVQDHQRSRPVLKRDRRVSENPGSAPTVSVVIPVKNEARNLPAVLNSLADWTDEVVLVDGHSVDGTVGVARQCCPGVKVVTQPKAGKGDAVLAGFKECTGDILVMMDGDGSHAGSELPLFVAALLDGADYAKGSRFIKGGGSDDITTARRLGNWVLSGLVNVVFGTRYTDLCYGYNALWSKHLPALNLDCNGFEIETVLNIRAAKAALQVREVPSYERSRLHGESNLSIVFDGWRILKAILAEGIGPSRGVGKQGAGKQGAGKQGAGKHEAGMPGRAPASAASSVADLPEHLAAGARLSRPTVPGLISVVICAHAQERWSQTRAAVESVQAQNFQNREIIVVVDHHPALHSALAAALPDVTVVENHGERGLSGARNTGVCVASGDVVAFLDDDAVADSDWLKFLADSYADPAVIGVGGYILPRWEKKRPSWFPAEFDWVVGCTYRGMPESRGQVRNLLGANASFRREAFTLAGGFRDGIGRGPGKRPLGCEETEFCIRLSQQSPGSVFLFEDRAVVWHLVPADRCRFSYFWVRCYAEGLSKALVTASVGVGDGLASERRYTTRTLPAGVARALGALLRGDWSGLGQAGAIVAGLAAAAAGYVVGTVSRRSLPTGLQHGA
jgi:glucosyl-dolichyl phosphate glucuronosyltransferase